MNFPIFPDQASTSAQQVDTLYFALTAVSLVFLAIIFLPMAWFLYKFRRGNPANRNPIRIPTTAIEITWTVIPLALSLGFFVWAAGAYFYMEVPPPDALELNVVGKQWMWKVQHPEGNREIDELHIPVGHTVKLTLASQDVIHSFYIPAFRIKTDVVPGRFTTQWFKPTRTGNYHLFCAEYCGTEHSRMRGTVYVMTEAAYQEWLARGNVRETLAQTGERLFRDLGCSGCHVGPSTVRSPPLDGVYGKLVPLQSGEIVRADDRYLRDSILLPQSQITAGYEPLMPTFQGRISEEDLLQLIAYLKSLPVRPPETPR